MSKWFVKYKINNKLKWDIYEAKHTWEVKDICKNKNNSNDIEFIEIEAYNINLLTEEMLHELRMKTITLV